MVFGNKEYFYAKTTRAVDVEFWQEIIPQSIIGEFKSDKQLKLDAGVYVVLFGVQVVTKSLENVSVGVFCKNEFVPEFLVMGTSMPNGILNLAGNGILVLDKECTLKIRNMTKGKIDCYEMMLSVCKI